jgi:Ca2+/H+ antiporter
MSDLALSIVLGIALAAATGFRVFYFLPMLVVSVAAYTGHLTTQLVTHSYHFRSLLRDKPLDHIPVLVESMLSYRPGR